MAYELVPTSTLATQMVHLPGLGVYAKRSPIPGFANSTDSRAAGAIDPGREGVKGEL